MGIKALKLICFPKNSSYLVFTMAKVGSLSVYSSLKKQKPFQAVFHIHSLSISENKKSLELCNANGVLPDSRSPITLINRFVFNKNRRIKIISMVRDPIERNISAFFDAFELYVGVSPEKYEGNMQELETIYHRNLPHDYAINWYENQFYNAIGINIYDFEFSIEKGFVTIQSKNIEIIILKTNVKDTFKENLLSDFCNCPNFKLTNTNQTKSQLYDEFKQYIKFSMPYLNKQYQSKYALHFFSQEERISAIKCWAK